MTISLANPQTLTHPEFDISPLVDHELNMAVAYYHGHFHLVSDYDGGIADRINLEGGRIANTQITFRKESGDILFESPGMVRVINVPPYHILSVSQGRPLIQKLIGSLKPEAFPNLNYH